MSKSILGRRKWTKYEIDQLHLYAEKWRGQDDRIKRLAERFGRTEAAIRRKIFNVELPSQSAGYLTVTEIAELLGVSRQAVGYWIKRGQFVRHVRAHGIGGETYQVKSEDVWDWLSDMGSWHRWEPGLITDKEWRLHFTKLREGWVRPADVVKHLPLARSAIYRLVRDNEIPHRRTDPWAVWLHINDIHAYKQAKGIK